MEMLFHRQTMIHMFRQAKHLSVKLNINFNINFVRVSKEPSLREASF